MAVAQPNPRAVASAVSETETEPAHLLVVDDDAEIRALLAQFLQRHGYRVSTAADRAGMQTAMSAARVDLIILDVMLPGDDGFVICRELRSSSTVPIIMLTAMDDETDRIIGLELGADDYIAKPFNPRELLARVKAVLRRASVPIPTEKAGKQARFDGWRLDLVRRELTAPDGVIKELTAGEYDLLLAFVENAQRVLTRDRLLDLTRGRDAAPFDRSIDIQVSRLRRKLELGSGYTPLIKTVRGAGYILAAKVEWL